MHRKKSVSEEWNPKRSSHHPHAGKQLGVVQGVVFGEGTKTNQFQELRGFSRDGEKLRTTGLLESRWDVLSVGQIKWKSVRGNV